MDAGDADFSHSISDGCPRQLTPEDRQRLADDTKIVSEFKQQKLEKEAQKNWDLFYKRNTTKFFKDRHWTTREFTELSGTKADGAEKLVILEVGCGVGNFMFPLLSELPNVYFYACDFSPRAVQFVKDSPLYDPDRCHVFQNDLTKDSLNKQIEPDSIDIASMIFVLSAIHPDKMVHALCNIWSVLKPGGCVLVRDYGIYDHAMLRFSPGNKLFDNFYVRQDGTRAYYFSKGKLSSIFQEAGFTEEANEYVLRETVNEKEQIHVQRVFIQGKFVKTDHIKKADESTTGVSKTDTSLSDDFSQKCDPETGSQTPASSSSQSDNPTDCIDVHR